MDRIEENCTHITNKLIEAIDKVKVLPMSVPSHDAILALLEVLIIQAQTIVELARKR
jgi:hypothetical protein